MQISFMHRRFNDEQSFIKLRGKVTGALKSCSLEFLVVTCPMKQSKNMVLTIKSVESQLVKVKPIGFLHNREAPNVARKTIESKMEAQCTVFESWHLKPGTRRLATGLIRTYQLERFLNDIRELTQQAGWKTQDGRMMEKCGARLRIPNFTRHFFVILLS